MIFNPLKKSVLVAALAFAGYGTLQAQVTTSNLSGIVTATAGKSVSNATIKATHLPSGTVYTATANASGAFNIANMRVGGPYRVEVTSGSEQPIIYEDVYLELGQPFVVNPVFGEKTATIAEVVLTGARGRNVNQTGAATNVGQKQIQELPQVSRSITEFTRLTPQANGNSFAGRDARYNNLQIDGANFNNGFGLSSNPLPGGNAQPISLDAIQEISVNIAPFDVTQSGFTGAGINAVTKSGTNRFHGSLYGYYNGKDLNGWKINGNEIQKVSGAKMTNGLTVGGPIVQNKLFFFVSGERETATGANASGANLWKASQDGIADPANNISRVKESDLIAVKNHLINRWGYDPGRYQGYADEAMQQGDKFLTRLDWNISDKHKFAVRYNYLKGTSMQVANATSGPAPRSAWGRVSDKAMTFENGNYSFENYVQSVTAELNSTFSSDLSNKFLFTYSKIQDTRKSPSDKLFPFVDIWDGSASGGNYISFGTELFTYLNDVYNDNFSFTNNLTYNLGRNSFTVGAAYEVQKFGNSYTRMGTGYYRYASVEDFLSTGTANEVAPISFGLTYPYANQDTYSRVNFGLLSAYLQDRITLTDKFNVTVGLRAELPSYLNDLTANPSIDALTLLDKNGNPKNYSSGEWPKSRVMLSPRLGFNYDVLGDRSLTLRGGTGIFTGRVPFVWLTNMPTNAGVLQNTVELDYAGVAPWIGNIRFHPEDIYYYVNNVPAGGENVFISTPKEGAPTTFALVDSDFKMPSVWRSSFGADFKIPNTPITLTTDILYTKDVNSVFQYGANRKESTFRMTNQDRAFYPDEKSYRYNDKIGANSAVVLTNSDTKGTAFSATFGASVRPWHGLSGSVFYTYSEAKEISANSGSSASSAWQASPTVDSPNQQSLSISNYSIPHRVVANLSYTIGKTTIGAYYNGENQGRYSYYYSNDVNGDGIANDLMYIPKVGETVKFADIKQGSTVLFTAAQQQEAFDKFIADNGLEKYRGTILPRNEFLLPWINRVDLRIAQSLFTDMVQKGDKVQITLDIINFGNLLNSKWGIQDYTVSSYGAAILGRSGAVSADPSFTMLRDGQSLVASPYRASSSRGTTFSAVLGFKYSF
ncbi:carboxypeptidase regulatory-like domain-containing protein [Chryseobacterium salipaludis]|uniref:TonB-dependent receptor n=1 Tax=Chryseobacterium TaxID=59732 RepID=UPI001FF49F31|nr:MULTISPECIES: TonB-dependent receptor [Chryseobacterium]MCJ8497207.1 carboxypeptidase regulatory-like domain-containing protein [Chryseobacterium salipaludis]MCX3295614.1 carboxypeptidase regulatory-like domain-containing protein [Planobacterium sp. JC490]